MPRKRPIITINQSNTLPKILLSLYHLEKLQFVDGKFEEAEKNLRLSTI